MINELGRENCTPRTLRHKARLSFANFPRSTLIAFTAAHFHVAAIVCCAPAMLHARRTARAQS